MSLALAALVLSSVSIILTLSALPYLVVNEYFEPQLDAKFGGNILFSWRLGVKVYCRYISLGIHNTFSQE